MIQEYLFMDDTHRTAVEKYAPAKIKVEVNDIENSTCWIVTYSLPGENEDSAKLLSQVNEYVLGNFSPTVLTNESSAYYNRKLYPYINEFERKLRKLLYLKSAIYQGKKKVDNIRDLETKDLGEIFELLFSDAEFVKNARQAMKDKSWQFTKQEIISALQDLAEDTVWDDLLGKESVTSLRNNFLTLKNYRNDVMHAHNIDAKAFRNAKKLFADINQQLDAEIGHIIRKVEEQPAETAESDFNEVLSGALQTQNLSGVVQQAHDAIVELTGCQPNVIREAIRQMQEYYASVNYPQLQASIKLFFELYSGTEYAQLQETLRQLTTYQSSPEFAALREQVQEWSSLISALKKIQGTANDRKREAFIDTSTKGNQSNAIAEDDPREEK